MYPSRKKVALQNLSQRYWYGEGDNTDICNLLVFRTESPEAPGSYRRVRLNQYHYSPASTETSPTCSAG